MLLIEDTWVTGGRAQSASAALREAGAERIAVVALGRYINPASGSTTSLGGAAYNWHRCQTCRHESNATAA